MYSQDDVGSTVYLPEFGARPCKIVDVSTGGDDQYPVTVSPPKGTGASYDYFTYDGKREKEDLFPSASRTPWTQRAVTERPKPEMPLWSKVRTKFGMGAADDPGLVVATSYDTRTVLWYENDKFPEPMEYKVDRLRPFNPEATLIEEPAGRRFGPEDVAKPNAYNKHGHPLAITMVEEDGMYVQAIGGGESGWVNLDGSRYTPEDRRDPDYDAPYRHTPVTRQAPTQ